jgi:hypothetical protein
MPLEEEEGVRSSLAVVLSVGVSACSVTDVDVGADQIPPMYFDLWYVGLPDQAELADPATIVSPSWMQVSVGGDGERTTVSADLDVEFLNADMSTWLRDQMGDKIKAVDGIDFQLTDLVITDISGDPVPLDPSVTAVMRFDGQHLMLKGRYSLHPRTRDAVLNAVRHGEALDLPIGLDLTGPPDKLPTDVEVWAVVQPILVVQIFDAL